VGLIGYHIVFGSAAARNLKSALKELGVQEEEQIISFMDIFSVGPVYKLHEPGGKAARMEWMRKCILREFEDHADYAARFSACVEQVKAVPDGGSLTIWSWNSAHEQTGLRFAAFLLQGKPCKFQVVHASDVFARLFHSGASQCQLSHSGEMLPEQFKRMYEEVSAKLLPKSEREQLEQDWLELSGSIETLRIWRNGTLRRVAEDYYDSFIIKTAQGLQGSAEQKGAYFSSVQLVGAVLQNLNQYVGDGFIEHRLKRLIQSGAFECEDNLSQKRFYQIRLKT